MYIKRLYLNNIRSYVSQELNLSKGINLIIGANNAGKSTIIKSLYKLQQDYSIKEGDIRKTCKQGQIFTFFDDITENDRLLFPITASSSTELEGANDDREKVVLFELFQGKEVKEKSYIYHPVEVGNFPYSKPLQERSIYGEEVIQTSFICFPDKENEQNFIYPFFAKRKHQLHYSHRDADAAYTVREDLSNLASKIMRIGNSSHPLNADYNRLCKEILNLNVGHIPGEQHENKLGVFVTDSATISLEAMGEGVVNVLGLLAILLTENNKLFLIEELENDLHPAALKKLLQLIIEKSESNQFVISTHSNIVVKYLGSKPDTKLFNVKWRPFEKESDTIRIPTSSIQVVSTLEERKDMLEELGYDLFDFGLYQSFLILEESSAEQIIRDFLIPHFTPQLTDRLRTIASQGADDLLPKFNDLHRLFLYVHSEPVYKNRAWAIGDGDEAGKKNIAKLQDKFKSWSPNHFISLEKPAFEYYYPAQYQQEVKQVLSIQNKQSKKEMKGDLLRRVLKWARENPEEAKQEFATSADEVIQILRDIEDAVLNSECAKAPQYHKL